MNIQQFLREQEVLFELIAHPATFDAQRMSHAIHVSGHHVAKTVLLNVPESEPVVVVLPAADAVDLDQVATLLNVEHVELASKRDMVRRFPDCQIGALPPFGSLYGLTTLVDEQLTHDRDIIFEANDHYESLKMAFKDFQRLEKPEIASFVVERVSQ